MRSGGTGVERERLGGELACGESARHCSIPFYFSASFWFLMGSVSGGGGKQGKWEVKEGMKDRLGKI